MTLGKLMNELQCLDKGVFVYNGEIYDEDVTVSIGYIPDIVCDVGDYLRYDNKECSKLSDYLQCEFYDNILSKYPSGMKHIDQNEMAKLFYQEYLREMKVYLVELINTKIPEENKYTIAKMNI